MPTVRLTWGDPNNNEEGHRVYRDTVPLDTANPGNLPVPIVDLAADVTTYDDTTAAADTTYYYAVAAYKGDFVNVTAEVQVNTLAPSGPNYSTAQIGDEIGGGIYAGTHTDGTATWHLIFGKQDSELGAQWGNYETTTGADDPNDGLANQNLILASFDSGDADAFYHCRDYVDVEGNSDYYLPARNELDKVQALVDMGHPEFSTSLTSFRWSSTELSSTTAYAPRFSDGSAGNGTKTFTSRRARPVRRVAV